MYTIVHNQYSIDRVAKIASSWIQYTGRIMHKVHILLWFVVVWYKSFFAQFFQPNPVELGQSYCPTASEAKLHYRILVNKLCKSTTYSIFYGIYCVNALKQNILLHILPATFSNAFLLEEYSTVCCTTFKYINIYKFFTFCNLHIFSICNQNTWCSADMQVFNDDMQWYAT